MRDWINVDERLPENIPDNTYGIESEEVETLDKKGNISRAIYYNYEIDLGCVNTFVEDGITHWRPLPVETKEATCLDNSK